MRASRKGERISSRHIVLAVVAALLYAGCYAAIKAGLAYAPPMHFAAWRACLASALLLSMLATTRQPLLPARRAWAPTMVLAIVGPLIGFSAMFASPRHSGVGLASVVGNTGPLLIIVLAAMFLGEPINRAKLIALICGLVGVSLIALPAATTSRRSVDATAILLPLVAAASGAGESVIVKWARLGSDAIRVAAWQYFLGSLALFLLAALLEPGQSITWTRAFVLLLALLGGGTTAAATALWYWLVQREDVSRLSLVLFLVPVAGLALGVALFGERIAPLQGGGILVILAGVGVAASVRVPRAGSPPRNLALSDFPR